MRVTVYKITKRADVEVPDDIPYEKQLDWGLKLAHKADLKWKPTAKPFLAVVETERVDEP
jgi:hypothetical protein